MATETAAMFKLTGRILLSLIFLPRRSRQGFGLARPQHDVAKGLPRGQSVPVGAIVLNASGLSVLTGCYKARLGAAALIFFLIPTTLIFHNFWAFSGMEQQMQMANFLRT